MEVGDIVEGENLREETDPVRGLTQGIIVDAITFGVKYGWKTRSDDEWSIRVEAYRQTGTVPSSQIIGSQASRDNYPDLNAIIVQVGYRF